MDENLLFTDKELAFLKELNRNRVPFMIVGLSAATLQGAPMVTQDVDLWFQDIEHPGVQKALIKLGGAYVPPIGLNPPMFAGKHVECFDIVLSVHGIRSFAEEYRHACKIKVGNLLLRVLPLDRIIASKEFLNREKDRMVLPALKAAARATRARSSSPRRVTKDTKPISKTVDDVFGKLHRPGQPAKKVEANKAAMADRLRKRTVLK